MHCCGMFWQLLVSLEVKYESLLGRFSLLPKVRPPPVTTGFSRRNGPPVVGSTHALATLTHLLCGKINLEVLIQRIYPPPPGGTGLQERRGIARSFDYGGLLFSCPHKKGPHHVCPGADGGSHVLLTNFLGRSPPPPKQR